jgi:hypothetical protein
LFKNKFTKGHSNECPFNQITMKKIILFLNIVVFSCSKNEVDTYRPGSVSAVKNGVNWIESKNYKISFGEGSVLSNERCSEKIHTLSVTKFNEFQERRESLYITNIPLEIMQKKILNGLDIKCGSSNVGANYYLLGSDGDAIEGVYLITESENNLIKITQIDKKNKFIEGEFELSFKKVEGPQNASNVIEFKNGYFKAYYDF